MKISTNRLRATWPHAAMRATRPRAAMRATWVTLLAAAAAGAGLIASSSPAGAQEVLRAASPPSGPAGRARVRVVATFDPETGGRSWEVLAPLSSSEILWIQEALARAGHPSGDAPGQLQSATREAMRSFQRERALEVCGCPSYETMVALGLEPQVVLTIVRSSSAEAAATGDRAAAGGQAISGAAQVEVIYPPSPPPAAAEVGGSETAPSEETHDYGSDLATSYFGLSHVGLILIPAGHHLGFFGLHHAGDGLHHPGTDGLRHPGSDGLRHPRLPSFQRVPFPPGRLSPPPGRLGPPSRVSGTPFHGRGR